MPISLVVHGHFYQPPRENPWTGEVDPEPSAAPFPNWNERVHAECYRPNAHARVFDDFGRVATIVNNYGLLNFDVGPTLMSWMQRHHPATHDRIVATDRESVKAHHGHGNAIAQGYNHAILPLCNARDRVTQVRWGLRDFRYRFGRDAESLWLPETAANAPTLDLMIDEGVRYVILAPSQAQAVRGPGEKAWMDVSHGTIDTTRAYYHLHQDGSGRRLAVFFYDAHLAKAIAFDNVLSGSSEALVDRFEQAAAGRDGLVHLATDGESYGHHTHFGDRCMAYALDREAPRRGIRILNYGEFLAFHAPTHEVRIKPGPDGEGTSWSCSHGVGRWIRDCGCHTGGLPGWNQAWRKPLRTAFDGLRDFAAGVFEEEGGRLFKDPWAARNDAVDLLLLGEKARHDLFRRHARGRLGDADQVRALTLLEIQRMCMLQYTSCGWFFSDLGGIETVQVMKYAARAMDLLGQIGIEAPRGVFMDTLETARSNQPDSMSGAEIFERRVLPSRVTVTAVAANLAMTNLVEGVNKVGESCEMSFRLQSLVPLENGRFRGLLGRQTLTSARTGRTDDLWFGVLHLGGVDFCCLVAPFAGMRDFEQGVARIREAFEAGSMSALLRVMQSEIGGEEVGLANILPRYRGRIAERVLERDLQHVAREYERIYEDHRWLAEALHQAGFDLPEVLRVATQFTLSRRLEAEIQRAQRLRGSDAFADALALADEIDRHGYEVDRSRASNMFSTMIQEAIQRVLADPTPARMRSAASLRGLAGRLGLQPSLDAAQEALYEERQRLPQDASAKGLLEAMHLDPRLLGPRPL